MKILFYGTKNYDEQFFQKLLPSFPGIEIKFIDAGHLLGSASIEIKVTENGITKTILLQQAMTLSVHL